jgi:hypothetical protein
MLNALSFIPENPPVDAIGRIAFGVLLRLSGDRLVLLIRGVDGR